MAITYTQTSFNAGELSPRLKGRSDLDKYKSGLFTCDNYLPLPHGGIAKRAGFKYINEVKDSTKEVELVPFEFSETDAYVLEFGDLYMRVFTDGGRVVTTDSDTVLLLHGDGNDGSITITDDGISIHTVSANGNAQIDTGQYYFATGSITLDGVGDYLSIPDHADFNFGATEMTMDFWVRFNSVTGIHTFYYQKDTTAGDMVWFYVDHVQNTLNFRVVDGGSLIVNLQETWNPTIDAWYHVALIRGWGSVTDDWAMCIDGTILNALTTDAGTLPNHDQNINIGGLATANTILDFSSNCHVISKINDATLSSAQSKWGDASILFDGTGDGLSIPDNAAWDILSQTNVTIDLWVLHDDHVGAEYYVSQFEDTDNRWQFLHSGGDGLKFQAVSGGVTILDTGGGGEITDTNWHHVAMCKVGDDYGIYLDGSQVCYVNDNSTDTFAGLLYIGQYGTGAFELDGYADDVRITHTNSFSAAPVVGLTDTITIPTAPHKSDSNTKLLIRADLYDLDGWLDEFRVSTTNRWTANFTPATQEYPGGGGSADYELVTPYDTDDDIHLLRVVQSADTLYIAHPRYNIGKLSRTDHDAWTITEIDWDEPPWNALNTTATTLDPSATTGAGIDVVASVAFFSQLHVGAYFKQANGFYRITAVTDSTNAVATVKSDLDDHLATADWQQGSWDDSQYYPGFLTFHEDRLIAVGDQGHPLRVFMSMTADYENFGDTSGAGADDPITQDIWAQQLNLTKWALSGKRLYIGTVGAEFWITGSTVDAPITPTSILVRRESTHGSYKAAPVMIGNTVQFVQKDGKKVVDWHYSDTEDGFEGTDIGILAGHLTSSTTIEKMAYAQDPDSVIWMIMADGTIASLTYLKEHKVVGYATHTSTDSTGDAVFESMAVIPGSSGDEVWVVAKRTIDSSTVRYIERLEPQFFGGTYSENAFFVDSGLSSLNGAAASTFAGLDHLEGETVKVFADSTMRNNATVSGGSVTISGAAAVDVHIGLGYNADAEIVVPRESGLTDKATDYYRIYRATFMLYEAGNGMQVGQDASNLHDLQGLTDGAANTGEYRDEIIAEYKLFPTIFIRNPDPVPSTLLAVYAELDSGDKNN
jgi:hypothetical protein